MSCSEHRPFWVSWGGGVISVGKGLNVGTGAFMTYNDYDFRPHQVSNVAMGDGGVTSAEFVILENQNVGKGILYASIIALIMY